MRWNISCKCLLAAVCVMMLANCAKRSARLLSHASDAATQSCTWRGSDTSH
jgi:hypothetical protein